ncbi:MAG: glutamate formimidoyltransferase, partial [Vicinamibacterales bacterium]|nr:glutamate formimidoyltransferase [Vicinamibacterales bacterium]
MSQLIECVPNFSEGRDIAVIKRITDAIKAVDGVTLLDVDPGVATNRTVVTFVGAPEPVIEAAVRAAANAKELIDMRTHTGAHPRFGAMDVCPLVPVANITMDEVVTLAHRLAERLGVEVDISGFLYEYAAKVTSRRNLAACRAGEYEALHERLSDPVWKTDFGPGTFDPAYGVTAVGARNFLVAYNVNLNTTSTRRANAIAFDVREKGRLKTVDGTAVLDERGNKVWQPGSLKCVKGIGWFIEEYGIAQISMNLTDISVTPVHVAFDECCARARARGIRVTGSEIVGLVPLASMLEAGKYFLHKQQRSLGVSDAELIKIAIKSMGLDEVKPFNPQEKIIEYAVASRSNAKRLADKTIKAFVHETASELPAPGGGSIAAVMGSLAAALATMVANLSAHKREWDDRWEEFSDWAEKGKALHDELLSLVDADTDAFNKVMQTLGLPKSSEAERAARHQAIQEATRGAIQVPMRIMQRSHDCFEVIRPMAESGLPASVSAVGVAALAARA